MKADIGRGDCIVAARPVRHNGVTVLIR